MKRCIVSSTLFLSLLSLPLLGQNDSLQKADEAFYANDFESAIGFYNEALSNEALSDYLPAKMHLAQSYLYAKQNKEAQKEFESIIVEDSSFAKKNNLYFWLGVSYYQQAEYGKSRSAFASAVAFATDDKVLGMSYYYLGMSYQVAEIFDQAIANYKKSLEYKADDAMRARTLYYLASLQLERGDFAEAQGNYSSLLLEFPTSQYSEKIQYYLAEIAFKEKDYSRAFELFSSYLGYYPETPLGDNILFYAGVSAWYLKEYPTSEKYLKDLLRDFPDSVHADDATVILANYYVASERYAEAAPFLEIALKEADTPEKRQQIAFNLETISTKISDSQGVQRFLALASKGPSDEISAKALYQAGRYFYQSDIDFSYQYFVTLFTKYPDSPFSETIAVDLIRYYREKGDVRTWESLVLTASRYYAGKPEQAYYLFLLADFYGEQDETTKSLQYYQEAVAVKQADEKILFESLYRIGYIYSQRKEFSRSTEYFETLLSRADESSPFYAKSLLAVGSNYLNVENHVDANRYFSRVLALFPGTEFAGQAQLYMGTVLLSQKKYRDAVLYFQQAETKLVNEESKAEALFWEAWSTKALGDSERALRRFESLIVNHSDSERVGEAYFQKGVILYGEERHQAALANLGSALEYPLSDGTRIETLYYKGLVEFILNRPEAGIATVTEISTIDPESSLPSEAYFRMGEYRYANKDYEDAYRWYTLNRIDYPNNVNHEKALIGSVRSLIQMGEIKSAGDILLPYIEESSEPAALAAASDVLLETFSAVEKGDPRLTALYSKVLKNPPSEAYLPFLLTYYEEYNLQRNEDFEVLKGYYNKPSVSKKDKNTILFLIGDYYQEEGFYDEAIQTWLTLKSREPLEDQKISDVMFKLSEAYEANEDYKSAADSYYSVAKRFPGQPELAATSLFRAWQLYRRVGDNSTADSAERFLLENYSEIVNRPNFPEDRSSVVDPLLDSPS